MPIAVTATEKTMRGIAFRMKNVYQKPQVHSRLYAAS